MVNKYFKVKKLTTAQQAHGLRSMYPDSECKLHRGQLDWTGLVLPTPLSETYVVSVSYRLAFSPKTYVREPKLTLYPGKPLPHVYDSGQQRLCLYYPGGWNASMSIAHTIVPWASEWLLFYELWLATGEWLGGGIHIESHKKEDNAIKGRKKAHI